MVWETMRGSRNFRQGDPGEDDRKKALTTFFFSVFNLFYSFTEGAQRTFLRKTVLFKGSKGGPTFSRGGVQMLISIETYRTCDFPGGSEPHIPTLDLRM